MDQCEQPEVIVRQPSGRPRNTGLTVPTNPNTMRLLLLASTGLLMSCTSPQQDGGSLNTGAFEARLDDVGAQLLDVRTANEFSGGHLANARNLDWTNGQLEAGMQELDKSKPVLLYCASGRRSAAAREFLRE